jgi:hypothetical protein
MELALAEQCAAKLWRLGRVLAYEADLITNAQAEDELLRAHEMSHARSLLSTSPQRTDIPTLTDVGRALHAAETAATKLTERTEAIRQLQDLVAMGDDDAFSDWTLYEVLLEDFRPKKDAVEDLFKGEVVPPFLARHARQLILLCVGDNGELDILQAGLAGIWAEKLEQLKQDADNRQSQYESLAIRYEAALERRRVAAGLPEAKDIEKIQRYEAHLERGLHKHLDRVRDLQEARGAVPPRGPSVAVLVQASPQQAPEETIAPIGSFAVEVPEGQMAPFGSFAVEAPEGQMAPFGSFDLEPAEITEEPAGVDGQG